MREGAPSSRVRPAAVRWKFASVLIGKPAREATISHSQGVVPIRGEPVTCKSLFSHRLTRYRTFPVRCGTDRGDRQPRVGLTCVIFKGAEPAQQSAQRP